MYVCNKILNYDTVTKTKTFCITQYINVHIILIYLCIKNTQKDND